MKTLVIMLIGLAVGNIAFAQTTAKDFNELKRSKKYLYSEITLPDEEEAKELALLNLINQINDSLKCQDSDMVITKDDMSNVVFLQMNRSTGVRVMAYCEKVKFFKVQDATVTAGEPTQDAKAEEPFVSLIEETEEPKSTETETAIQPREELLIEASETTAEACTLPLPDSWIMNTVETLMQKTDIEAFCLELKAMQSNYKISRFGTIGQCHNKAGCYWGIFDSQGSLKAILSEGNHVRRNFMTNLDDSLANYENANNKLIWFKYKK